jgi:hypothetical protein
VNRIILQPHSDLQLHPLPHNQRRTSQPGSIANMRGLPVLLMLHALIYALGRTTEDTVLPHTVAALVPQTDATLSGVLLQHADQALRPWQQEVLRPSSPYPPTVRNPNGLQQWRRAAERRHPTGRDDLGLVHPADTSRSNLVTPWLCFRGGGFLYFRELLGRRRNQLRCFARLPPCVTRYFSSTPRRCWPQGCEVGRENTSSCPISSRCEPISGREYRECRATHTERSRLVASSSDQDSTRFLR